MLKPGNLPCLANSKAQLRIATSSKDKKWLQAQHLISRVGDFVELQIHECDSLISSETNKYELMNKIYSFLHEKGGGNHHASSVFIYWQPDIYLPPGSLAWISSQFPQYKAILAPGIRVNKEDFMQDVKEILPKLHYPSKLHDEQIHKSLIKNLHSLSLAIEVDSYHFNNRWPSFMLCVDRNINALVAKGFHYHPIAIYHSPHDFLREKFGTIDDRLIDCLGFSENEILMTTSSSQLLPIELSSKTSQPLHFSTVDYKQIAIWASTQSARHNANFSNTYIAAADVSKLNEDMILFLDNVSQRVCQEKIASNLSIRVYQKAIALVRTVKLKLKSLLTYAHM